MELVRRIFVEKKPGFDIEAKKLYDDISTNLSVKGLMGLRILIRYDVCGISDEAFENAKATIFSEPPVDFIYDEQFKAGENDTVFAVEYLPGQYDQRADSAVQCVQLITESDKTEIAVAKVFVLEGGLSEEDIEKVKHYCINPVDSREASLEKPETLAPVLSMPEDVKTFDGFTDMTDGEVLDLKAALDTAMSGDDLIFCRNYFKNTEKRNPTMTEIKVIDTYWSDHCRHTTFQTKIEKIEIEDGFYKPMYENAYRLYIDERKNVYKDRDKDICLMDLAVMGMKALKAKGILDNLDESEEINACSIVVDAEIDGVKEPWLIMFKNETHNHPTEIEPFGGAATCLGGAIRDPLSGRSYVYQAMRVTGAGDPRTPVSETIPGKLPQRKITTEAARGYSSYGNQIGLATGQVTELYDEGFVAKRMEVGAVIAANKKENVVRMRPSAGDIIILTGGRTGRDGCGGATGSSKAHTLESINECGAEVQKGNAPTERKLQRLFRNPDVSRLIKRCNDFGAGGVSVAIGELADGLEINLDRVPKKYDGLDGTELAISESQERMAVVVDKNDADKFIKFAEEENLEATVVAVVTDDRRLKMTWRGKTIVDISRDFLDTNGVKQKTDVTIKMPAGTYESGITSDDYKQCWLESVKSLNTACQKGLSERFDSTIGAGTVLMPFGGKYQLTPAEAMAAKIPLERGETETSTVMSFGYSPKISKWSPFHGAAYAVVESLSKLVASGAKYSSARLSFQEYFEKLGTSPEKWGKPFAALLGGFEAQMAMGTAAIGGKDSMSGTFMDISVPPTLISFAVAPATAENIISPEFKAAGSTVVYMPIKKTKFGAPDYEYLKKLYSFVEKLIENKTCISAAVVKEGGIAEAVSKMVFGNKIGIKFNSGILGFDVFKPDLGSFVLELSGVKVIDFNELDATILGTTTSDGIIAFDNGESVAADDIIKAWKAPLEGVFATEAETDFTADPEIKEFKAAVFTSALSKIAKPRVFIPVFPGTNCEYDTKKAFETAGGDVTVQVIRNLSVSALEDSIRLMEKNIRNSQIVMIPGGFSAGDEPDGSGKFIAAVFRNPYVKEAVTELIKNRDGLMLGICNGFQALIKLGLVPYGEIRDMDCESPTLTFNTIGRHVSCMVNTKIVSNKSPWLWGTETGDIHTIPVSHGEGRFVADESVIKSLIANNQVATQYVDFNGKASYDIRYNPNGSYYAIEGITSPDGRILGKMGHSERIGHNLYKNIPGNKNQKIFESGINYFK